VKEFLQELAVQRWDDHRFYHHSRINQSLHLLSAVSFVVAYGLLFVDPAWAAILAWCVSMTSRQAGHFFFEPRGFDHVNKVSDEYKEEIKVGYNLRRKVVLLTICAAIPVIAYWMPDYLTWAVPEAYEDTPVRMTAMAWLFLGAAGLIFRVLQLWVQDGLMAGVAWALKIITDPFHDVKMYYRAPFYLAKGQFLDPMDHVKSH
jgi:hypothetical protein